MSDGITFLTQAEGRAWFDGQARRLMGLSGEEFLRRYDAGWYDEICDDATHPHGMAVVKLAMLRPFWDLDDDEDES